MGVSAAWHHGILAVWQLGEFATWQIIGSLTAKKGTSGHQPKQCLKGISISASLYGDVFKIQYLLRRLVIISDARLLLPSIKPENYKHPCLSPRGCIKSKSIAHRLVIVRDALD